MTAFPRLVATKSKKNLWEGIVSSEYYRSA